VDRVLDSRHRLAVITGGEPFRQNIGPLIEALLSNLVSVQVETNGTLPPSPLRRHRYQPRVQPLGQLNAPSAFIVCSPKTGKVLPSILESCCALKYVLDADSLGDDGLPLTALGHTANPWLARPPLGWDRAVYLQPADHKDEAKNRANIDATIRSCLANGYTLQLQIHKYLNLE
jgi:7-carboxy-7-deazaguanine synthase